MRVALVSAVNFAEKAERYLHYKRPIFVLWPGRVPLVLFLGEVRHGS